MRDSEFLKNSHFQAVRLAKIHLQKFKPLIGNKIVGSAYPLFQPGSDSPAFYEVNLQESRGKEDGYLIVSLLDEYPPVIMFSPEGSSKYLQLVKCVRIREFRPVFFPPFYYFAEDEDGKYLAHLDPLPVFPTNRKHRSEEIDYEQLKQDFKNVIIQESKEISSDIQTSWKTVKNISDGSKPNRKSSKVALGTFEDYVNPDDLPERDYQVVSISHPEYLPAYMQLLPMSGANELPWRSGCSSLAWMVVIGYYNNTGSLDLLRGTHYSNEWNEPNSYISRVTMALSIHMGTFAANGTGGGINQDQHVLGYSFIEQILGHPVLYKFNTQSGGVPALQIIYDALIDQHAPSVVDVPGHSVVAFEALIDLSEDSNDHHIRVYEGGGNDSNRPYIAHQFLQGAWAVGNILPKHDFNTGVSSECVPATIQVGDPDVSTKLVLATRATNGNICLFYSDDGRDFFKKYEISASGSTPPALANLNPREQYYVAWKESDGELQLVQVDDKSEEIIHLPAPAGPSQWSVVGPVIAVIPNFLFYIWDGNIHFTNEQNLERPTYTWPTALGYNAASQHGLESLGFILPLETPSLSYVPYMVPEKHYLYFAYQMERNSRIVIETAIFECDHDPMTNEFEFGWVKDLSGSAVFPGCRKILNVYDCFIGADFWGIVYGTNGGPICEFVGDRENNYSLEWKYFPPGIATEDVNLGVFSSYEIGPCVFSLYLDGDNRIRIRYHSIDAEFHPVLDYEGYPDF